MEIFVCRGYSGQIFRLNINENESLEQIIPVIAAGIGFYSSNEERIGLYNLTRDWEYFPRDTLASRGTKAGDLLILADGGACHKEG
jgi:hypothetical protein